MRRTPASATQTVAARTAGRPAGRTRITISQAAESYSVSTRTIRRWIAAGILTGYRVGPTLIRLDADEVEALGRRIPAGGRRGI